MKVQNLVKEFKPDVCHIGHLNHLSTGIIKVLKSCKIPIVFTLHDFWLMCPRGQFLQRNFDGQSKYNLCSGQEHAKCASTCYNSLFTGKESTNKDDFNYWEKWVYNRMEETKSVAKSVNRFIAPSQYLKNRFVDDFQIDAEGITYLDYGFPMEYLTTKSTPKSSEFTFGYIGTHIPSKGIDLLIKAFSKIDTAAKLKIFGREIAQNTNALKQMAANSKNEIEFCGEYINQNIADVVFSEIDAIVVPSIWGENSPLVIHEAQACKIPVITADFGGMKEYVSHQLNGLLFEHRNEESLHEQLEWALANPSKMRQYGNRGYIKNETGLVPDIKLHCKQLVKIYKETINEYAS